MDHVYYGRVKLERGDCPFCLETALIRDGERLCCGRVTTEKPTAHKVLSPIPKRGRHKPSKLIQERILEAQGHMCFYCDREFGSVVWVKRERTLRVHWDHVTPYVHTFDNREVNFVAACQICNGWKSDKVFDTIEEIRGYLQRKWDKAMSSVPEVFSIG